MTTDHVPVQLRAEPTTPTVAPARYFNSLPQPATEHPSEATAALVAVDQAALRRRERLISIALRSASIVGFFVLWYAASLLNQYVWKLFNPVLLPPPHKVLEAGI